MMDALLTGTQTVTGIYPFWDFQVIDGIVPIIYNTEESSQQAVVMAYTQFGLVKQNPDIGVDWTGLLTGSSNFSNIDTQIVQGLSRAGLKYRPTYKLSTNGRQVIVTIVKQ